VATTRRFAPRRKGPVRWAIIALSCAATVGAYQATVAGPPPAHAAPPPPQVVVQPAPTLDQMISQIRSQQGDQGGLAGSGGGPVFRTRGS
jgi:hypothetical protein